MQDYNDDIRKEQMREMQMINNSTATSNVSMAATTESSTNNGNLSGASDEGSCSPHSNGSEAQSPSHGEVRGKGCPPSSSSPCKGSNGPPSSLAGVPITSPHPAFRGLNRAQTSVVSASKSFKIK